MAYCKNWTGPCELRYSFYYIQDEKKTITSAKESDEALLAKSSLEIPLVKEQETDKKLAQLMKYRTVECKSISVVDPEGVQGVRLNPLPCTPILKYPMEIK